MNHGSLFSGIGGFDLAAEWAGWNNVFHCEINPFGRKVLNYYWPKAISYDDITTTDFTIHRGQIDILTGGFPCQPFSVAGKRKGTEDDRNLWPEYYRAIKEIQPTWVVGENVPGIINWSKGLVFEQVQADLENEGYEVWPVILPACSVNAPHKRERVWFVAYCENNRNRFKQYDNRDKWIQQDSERWERMGEQHCNISGIRAFTNPNSNGHELRGFGEYRSAQTKGEAKEQERERIWNNGRRISEQGITSDTNELNGDLSGFRTGKISQYEPSGVFKNNSTNSNSQRQQKCDNAGQPKGQKRFNRFISSLENFQNFPTQSPICSGNDGLSDRLDGITFPKWRNESIKAYGNAIVPQVAYQIFKTINEFTV